MREIIRREEIRETLEQQIREFVGVAKQQQRLTFIFKNPHLIAQARKRRDLALHTAKIYREILEAN